MNLADWCRLGWLTEHETSKQEISDLLALADRDLTNSQIAGLDPDWRLTIAYNAALQLATAALAASGYRAAREMHHYRVVQSLPFTIGADAALVGQLDQYRRKRHQGAYERAGLVSEREADEMHALAVQLRDTVLAWLRAEHPDLLLS
jgi:hypothetical protein